ncbi:PQQ-dependent sugar dehydrogenase [Telluribacter sp.]|jgi:glucose/arabinose dehydrogenase|uniref:PQQ-dependent sugar dehydrogenase n=1 Tax=Telluribacter sp. TaxID=1978767 RepID=UPI002E149C2E|nr:PQQ-dependent sugar dehydrogenase [Telluribacter sp.]
MKYVLSAIFLLVTFGVGYAQEGKSLYSTHCAGCHGVSLAGTTSGPALIKNDWKTTAGKEIIAHAIRAGVPGTTMVAWDKALTSRQIEAITDFISTSQQTQPGQQAGVSPVSKTTSAYTLKIEKIVTENLKTPWGIEFVSKDSALVTEKRGTLRWLVKGELVAEPISGLPVAYLGTSTAGLMDIALDPDYRTKGWVYLAISQSNGDSQAKNALALTKIIRGKVKQNRWVEEQTLFEVPDSLKVVNGNRWGCRFLFDKDGYLFFSIGDMGKAMDSQDPGKATGKVFRINPDGSIPKDNPFADKKGALAALYSLGNRNVQGISQHPETGNIWITEHGPKGGDELNILKKGANYGWPVITYGIDYNGDTITDKTHQEGMEQPVTYWTPSIAVSAAEFCTSPLFPAWRNNLLVGALAFQELRRLSIDTDKVVDQELLLKGMGRIRDIKFGPDGALYVLTNDPDGILRITVE